MNAFRWLTACTAGGFLGGVAVGVVLALHGVTRDKRTDRNAAAERRGEPSLSLVLGVVGEKGPEIA